MIGDCVTPNSHNPHGAKANKEPSRYLTWPQSTEMSRAATRRAGFAKGKVRFQHADTDRQPVTEPRQHAAVSLLQFFTASAFRSLEFRGREKDRVEEN